MAPLARELSAGQRLDAGFFAVAGRRVHQKKDGQPFIRAQLRDTSGIIEAVVWDGVEEAKTVLVEGKVVKVKGLVQKAYQGNGVELTIEKLRLARPEDGVAPEDFLPQSCHSPNQLIQAFHDLVATLRAPLQDVVWACLEEPMQQFATLPAATRVHHAWVGGLLEHTLEVANLSGAIASICPDVDRDLVVAGALLHDIGKLDVYVTTGTFEATDVGKLVGHILTGYHRVQVACEAVDTAPDITLHLLHIVASHHGTLQFGAAREPMTREAIVVHHADVISADVAQATALIAQRSTPDSRWTERGPGLRREVFAAPGT